MYKYRIIALIILPIVCFGFGLSKITANALSIVPEDSKGLTLSPLRSELGIAPGTSLDGELTVTNSTETIMTVNLSAEEFSVINQQYDYAFSDESDIAKWITFDFTDINLKAGEGRKIKFSVNIPLSTEPGGRYVSLFAGTDTGSSDTATKSRQRVASLLYITVLGDVTRAGHLVSLTSPWLIGGDSQWGVALQNTGTTHFRSRYSVQIKSLWNDKVTSTSGEALILPATVRLINDDLSAPQIPGIYKVIYTIGLGDTPAKVETRLILYLPLWMTAILIIIVLYIIFKVWRKRQTKHQSV